MEAASCPAARCPRTVGCVAAYTRPAVQDCLATRCIADPAGFFRLVPVDDGAVQGQESPVVDAPMRTIGLIIDNTDIGKGRRRAVEIAQAAAILQGLVLADRTTAHE